MSQFDKPLTGVRWAETWVDDTLQEIAARELGDATQWTVLANLNNLIPPYFNPPSAAAQTGILRYGDLIMVPATGSITSTSVLDQAQIFGTDIALPNGQLVDDGNGDFLSISGAQNLQQALQNRLNTPPNDLIFHPEYRNKAWGLIGKVNGPTAELLAAQYCMATLSVDDRVQSVDSATANITGDQISAIIQITPIVGQSIMVAN